MRPRYNPRAREGSDTTTGASSAASHRFNPRAPEGRDHAGGCDCWAEARFNPRAREGRDRQAAASGGGGVVSIHAPVKGATVPMI